MLCELKKSGSPILDPLPLRREIFNGGTYLKETNLLDIPLLQCPYFGENTWYNERINKYIHATNSKFQMCCGNGKVQLLDSLEVASYGASASAFPKQLNNRVRSCFFYCGSIDTNSKRDMIIET